MSCFLCVSCFKGGAEGNDGGRNGRGLQGGLNVNQGMKTVTRGAEREALSTPTPVAKSAQDTYRASRPEDTRTSSTHHFSLERILFHRFFFSIRIVLSYTYTPYNIYIYGTLFAR